MRKDGSDVERNRKIEIKQHCCGFELTIDDYYVGSYKNIRELTDYLIDRIKSDFR